MADKQGPTEGAKHADMHATHSTLREHIVEHVFVGEALRDLWRRGVVDVEVLRSEFDAHGYDLVVARGKLVRHVQLKTSTAAKPSEVSVPLSLAEKPSGCIIWIHVNDALDLGPFFWFGGRPGMPLPDVSAFEIPLRATHNKDGVRPPRTAHRLVPGAEFQKLHSVGDVLEKLLGEAEPK